jgi:hypothetical protein
MKTIKYVKKNLVDNNARVAGQTKGALFLL